MPDAGDSLPDPDEVPAPPCQDLSDACSGVVAGIADRIGPRLTTLRGGRPEETGVTLAGR